MAKAPPLTPAREAELPPELDDPLYRQALGQLDQALQHAEIHPSVAAKLRYPERALSVSIPVKLDDGSLGVFPGYRVQHSSVLGPTRAGFATTWPSPSVSAPPSPCG